MKNYLTKMCLALFLGTLIVSCSSNDKQAIVLDEKNEVKENFVIDKDSTAIQVLKLPVYIDSTTYLYHPIAIERVWNNEGFSIGKRGYDSYSKSSNYNSYIFNGEYAGFIVEDITTGNKVDVISQEINIYYVKIYNKLEYNPRVEFVLYQGYDLDTNKDQQLNNNDLNALFISNLDGTHFKKLTPDFEQLTGHQFIVVNDKLYFQTQKDLNANGTYDSEDGYRNYEVDLKETIKTATRYDEQLMNITKQ